MGRGRDRIASPSGSISPKGRQFIGRRSDRRQAIGPYSIRPPRIGTNIGRAPLTGRALIRIMGRPAGLLFPYPSLIPRWFPSIQRPSIQGGPLVFFSEFVKRCSARFGRLPDHAMAALGSRYTWSTFVMKKLSLAAVLSVGALCLTSLCWGWWVIGHA